MSYRYSERLGGYLESLLIRQAGSARHNSRWLRELRDTRLARFRESGFPTTHDEDWRFTNVAAIARTPFRLAATARSAGAFRFRLEPCDARRGLRSWSSSMDDSLRSYRGSERLPDGVTVADLGEHNELLAGCSNASRTLPRYPARPFCALNTAFAEDGAFVHVGARRFVEAPDPSCSSFHTAAKGRGMTHPRNLIVVEEESQATIMEEYVSFGSGVGLLQCVDRTGCRQKRRGAHT